MAVIILAWGTFALLVPIVPDTSARPMSGDIRSVSVSISYYLLGMGGTEWCNKTGTALTCNFLWESGPGP